MADPKDIDHSYTEEIVCPHCGDEWQDSWECGDNDEFVECEECGKFFSYERDIDVTYSTKKTTQEEWDAIRKRRDDERAAWLGRINAK
jgi:uncharacterized Zn finger protein